MLHTELAAATKTSTSADTGADISAISGDWTVIIEIQALSGSDASVTIALEDTVNSFSALLPGPAVSVSGSVGLSYTKRYTFTKKDFPTLRFGTSSAKLRTNLYVLNGTGTPSVTYHAWIES